MTTTGFILFALIFMAAVLLVLFSVMILATMHKESKFNKDFFMSSTSMFFGDNNLHTGAVC